MSQEPEGTMTFWEHLEELRSRIVRMAVSFLVGAGVAWAFREKLLVLLTLPFVNAWNQGGVAGKASLHFPAPADLFVAYIKLSVLGGFVMALPFMLYQVWAFVAPGLYAREKRLAVPFVGASLALFAGGGYFGWKVAFPAAFQYLLGFAGPVGGTAFEVTPTVMIGDYIEFVTQMLLAFGVTFEIPVVVFFLALAGIVDHTHLIKFFRYFIVIAFVVAAVVTPPDITSQILLAVPLIGLYGLSIGLAWAVSRSRRRAAAAEGASPADGEQNS